MPKNPSGTLFVNLSDTISTPSLLNPNLFINALSFSSLNTLGLGFPSCLFGVTVPTSIKPKPNLNSQSYKHADSRPLRKQKPSLLQSVDRSQGCGQPVIANLKKLCERLETVQFTQLAEAAKQPPSRPTVQRKQLIRKRNHRISSEYDGAAPLASDAANHDGKQ